MPSGAYGVRLAAAARLRTARVWLHLCSSARALDPIPPQDAQCDAAMAQKSEDAGCTGSYSTLAQAGVGQQPARGREEKGSGGALSSPYAVNSGVSKAGDRGWQRVERPSDPGLSPVCGHRLLSLYRQRTVADGGTKASGKVTAPPWRLLSVRPWKTGKTVKKTA